MKSNIRQRSSLAPPSEPKPNRKVSWDPSIPASNITSLETPLLSAPLIFTYVILLCVMSAVSLHFFMYLPNPVSKGEPNDFIAANSRAHMEDLVSLGIRHVGSDANEIHAKAMLIDKVNAIKAMASERVTIELSVQEVTGSYYLVDFLSGMNHIYQNITNIVVRLSRKSPEPSGHAFLINAHYDSALGTVAASDDAISCGTMLESLRALSSDPHPMDGEHSLIFLFNGAEETILQASHGFITQHPWAKDIKAFLNLEACGAGGREIVFQTGPEHPWLSKLYAKVVPHPHASIVAQELFQTGVIPSDTDFRIFRDYGHVPGIDTAYFVNGYLYHTEYDRPEAIPDGSIQRAGENVVAILREVAKAPQLGNPSEEDAHGKVVFFDLMGLMAVVYPDSVAKAINYTVALLVLLSVWGGLRGASKSQDKPTLIFMIKTMVVMMLSWVGGVAMVTIIGVFLSWLGRSMSWFANPLLIIPLYVVPAVLAVGELNVQWMKWNRGMSRVAMERSSFLASQLLLSITLLLMTFIGLGSAFVPLILASFPLIFRTLLLDTLITTELKNSQDSTLYGVAYMLCCVLGAGLPLMLSVQLDVGLYQMFVPLTGRIGGLVPPDLLIGIATALLVCMHSLPTLHVLIFASSASLKRWSGLVFLLIFSLALYVAGSGYIHPFSVSDPENPRPKRFYLAHTDQTFHNFDSSVNRTASNVHIFSLDYLEMEPILESSPTFREAKTFPCEGLYCSEVTYMPLRHMIKNTWYLPAPPLPYVQPIGLSVADRTQGNNRKNTTFKANFPKRGSLLIAPMEGHTMTAWSVETFVPPPTSCPGAYQERGCFYVFLSRGFGDGEFTFWIETENEVSAKEETLEIVFVSHNLDPPLSRTEFLTELESTLPDWVTTISWTSKYIRWLF